MWIILFCLFLMSGCSALVSIPSVPYFKHRVVEGETLWSLSRQYGVDVEQICRLNPSIRPSELVLGSFVVLPLDVVSRSKNWSPSSSYVFPVDLSVAYQKKDLALAVNHPSVSVYSVKNGKIIMAKFIPGWGYTVLIDCGQREIVQYSGLRRVYVMRGDIIFQGQDLGVSCSVPLLKDSSVYVYLQIYREGKKVDTLTFLKRE